MSLKNAALLATIGTVLLTLLLLLNLINNVLDLAKLQGAYTHAWTRNKSEGNSLKQFDGLEAANATLAVRDDLSVPIEFA